MENEGKKSKTEPSGISLTPAVKAAGKLMASRRFPNSLTGNFSAYIRELIERDVMEEIRRDPDLNSRISQPVRDPISAFLEADAANSASARDQRVADKVRADAQSSRPPKANEVALNKPRTAEKRGQSPLGSDLRSSPKEKD